MNCIASLRWFSSRSLSGTPLRSRGTTVQSRRLSSAKSRVALAFCSGLSEARNLFAASAIAAAERIRATPSTTDQVTSATATIQDDRITASFKVFIFGLRVIFGIQVLRFETQPIYAGQKSKSILPSESISLIVSAVGQSGQFAHDLASDLLRKPGQPDSPPYIFRGVIHAGCDA